jgi:hypothetical protein
MLNPSVVGDRKITFLGALICIPADRAQQKRSLEEKVRLLLEKVEMTVVPL